MKNFTKKLARISTLCVLMVCTLIWSGCTEDVAEEKSSENDILSFTFEGVTGNTGAVIDNEKQNL